MYVKRAMRIHEAAFVQPCYAFHVNLILFCICSGTRVRQPALVALLLQQQGLTPPAPGSISNLSGARRALAGGFFDQLKKSFNKEVEQNKEFKESLSKLRKETGDLTDKTFKLTDSVQKYSSAFSTRLSETTETLSKSSQAVVSQLKEKMAAAQQGQEKEKEEEGGDAGARGAAAAARPTEESKAPSVESTAETVRAEGDVESQPLSSASTSTQRRREEKVGDEAGGEGTVKTSTSGAHNEESKGGGVGEEAKDDSSSSSSTNGGSTSSTAASADGDSFYTRWLAGRPPREAARAWTQDFKVGLKEAFADLFGMQEKSTGMKKHIYQHSSTDAAAAAAAADKVDEEKDDEAEEAEKKAVGRGALVVVKQQQKTWERLAEQLKDAPIIQEILKAGTKLADTELGRQAGKLRGKLNDRVEDAREMWETSQNPLVYKLSSMWDDLTSETELGIALREIRRADPEFVMEDWVGTLTESFLPLFFKAYLKGDLKTLKPYLSEGMYKQMAEEFRLRKAEGLALDPHVLEISNAEIVQAKIHDHQPVLVLGTLIQHINCVRNREGKIVEGKEDEVRASFYLLLFVREYDEKEGALQWKIQERYLGFSQPFI